MIASRMKAWRDKKRARSGGMTEITVWASEFRADRLRLIFERLARFDAIGETYFGEAAKWLSRRRPPLEFFRGASYSAEIDGPFFGPHWHLRPAGGRITGALGTWIELSPDEADDVRLLCASAVSSVLETYLQNNKLIGRLRDDTGVALNVLFAEADYPQGQDDYLRRPANDAAFERAEAARARDVDRAAYASRLHKIQDPRVFYFDGFFSVPSRCYAFIRDGDDGPQIIIGHINYGGTSPTNAIETLAVALRDRHFPRTPFDKIKYYDCWAQARDEYRLSDGEWRSVRSLDNIRIQRVTFDRPTTPAGPSWGQATDLAPDVLDELTEIYTADLDSAYPA
ncbi:MAG: hypothetical protein KGL46_09765 [Hyphomicrobiales bacterium]|nr:hypothetical protein [Hyphomicrobiales bacterium]